MISSFYIELCSRKFDKNSLCNNVGTYNYSGYIFCQYCSKIIYKLDKYYRIEDGNIVEILNEN